MEELGLGIATLPAEIELKLMRERIMARGTDTGRLIESETAVTVRDQAIEQQMEKIHELEENLKFWKEQAALLAEQNERLQLALKTAVKMAIGERP